MRVTIFGLGRYEHGSGLAAVKFFMDQNADLLITDQQSESDLHEQIERVKTYARESGFTSSIIWGMGEHKPEYITNADLVVFNQAVPITSEWVQLAKKNKVPVESEITLFFKHCPAKIIGITGTRGKSTTTALIHHILKENGFPVHLGGNIASRAALELLPAIKTTDFVVIEISNFMLEYLDEQKRSPWIAVLTNVLPDHLSRYMGSMQAYADVKAVITRHQKPDEVFITSKSNTFTQAIAARSPARVLFYDEQTADLTALPLRGEHNTLNALAAVTVCRQLGLDDASILEAIKSFQPLVGRQQFVRERNGVTYINDTTATTPDALLAALQSFHDRTLLLIAGGSDKGLDFGAVAQVLPAAVKAIVWLPGEGTQRLKVALKDAKIDQYAVASMEDAVKRAHGLARTGEVVLLSPGCASFGLFKNEFDRGDQFNQAVMAL